MQSVHRSRRNRPNRVVRHGGRVERKDCDGNRLIAHILSHVYLNAVGHLFSFFGGFGAKWGFGGDRRKFFYRDVQHHIMFPRKANSRRRSPKRPQRRSQKRSARRYRSGSLNSAPMLDTQIASTVDTQLAENVPTNIIVQDALLKLLQGDSSKLSHQIVCLYDYLSMNMPPGYELNLVFKNLGYGREISGGDDQYVRQN